MGGKFLNEWTYSLHGIKNQAANFSTSGKQLRTLAYITSTPNLRKKVGMSCPTLGYPTSYPYVQGTFFFVLNNKTVLLLS